MKQTGRRCKQKAPLTIRERIFLQLWRATSELPAQGQGIVATARVATNETIAHSVR